MTDLVSVVIPTYNRADFLKEAVESVLAQTYENLELLVLDNFSSDHTPDVIAGFKDPRIKYLRHRCNIGATANWSYGIYWAEGKYLSILCDDDMYTPGFLVKRVQAFSRHDNAAAVFSAFKFCDMNGTITGNSGEWGKEESVVKGRDLLACAVGGYWHLETALYRTDIVQNLWNHTRRAGKAHPMALNIKIALNKQNHAVWLPAADLLYRCHSAQDSEAGGDRVLMDSIRAHKEPLENGEADEYRDILNDGIAWANNILGRTAWNEGRVKMARRYFIRELQANPYRMLTWLRLLRCLVMRPKPLTKGHEN